MNPGKNGVEIYFASKPGADVLARLKGAGFHWNGRAVCWYHRHTPENLAIANEIARATPVLEATPAASVPVEWPDETRAINKSQPATGLPCWATDNDGKALLL